MFKRFSRMDKEEISLIVVSGVLLILIALLFSLLMSSMIEREDVLLRYDAEQILADYLFRVQTNTLTAEDILAGDSKIKGIGVYLQDGRRMAGLGEVPSSLNKETYDFSEGNFADYDKSTGLIEYVRKAKLTFTASRIPDNEQFLFDQIEIPVAEYLYIAFDGKVYRQKMLLWNGLTVVVIGLLIFIFYSLLRFFKRNREYRQKLAQQESLVRMGQAARTLAHEIKNPLSALSIQSAVLRKTIPDDYHEGLDVIDTEILRLKNLSDRVGDFLRNPVGDPEDIELMEFLEEITGLFSISIPLTKEGHHDAAVRIDRDRARSIFENLVKNGIESCEAGAEEVSVTVKTSRHEVHIMVADRGRGLPEGGTEQLFDPFFTTKINGSGIGLAITRRFIMAAGGTIAYQKREGGGTVVDVMIPRSM